MVASMDQAASGAVRPKGFQLPDDDEFKEELKKIGDRILRKDDVTKEYKCISKMIGSGQMGTIVKVRCLKEGDNKGKVMICKMITLKEPEWAEVVRDEISVMMLNEGDTLVKCYDSFDFKGKYWIMLEMMDGDVLKLV